MSAVVSTDLEVIRNLLEKAEIDFEELDNEEKDTLFIETTAGVYFSFSLEGDLTEVSNG